MGDSKEIKLTGKQEKFCLEYLKDFNASRAALEAGYSKNSYRATGNENLQKPEIRKRIAQLTKEANKEDPKEVIKKCIRELEMIAFSDFEDFWETNDDGIRVLRDSKTLGEKTRLIKEFSSGNLKLHDKKWAFEMLGKYYGFLKESVDITSNGETIQPQVNFYIPKNGREAE